MPAPARERADFDFSVCRLLLEVDPHPVKNLHNTILTAMGLRPDDLAFEHNGRPERLTGVAGSSGLIPGVLAQRPSHFDAFRVSSKTRSSSSPRGGPPAA